MSLPATYSFRWGEGQISGFLSTALGVLGVLALLCCRFPALLTFPELHAMYDPTVLRAVLAGGLAVALLLGVVNFAIGRWRTLGCIGVGAVALALVLGGPWAPVSAGASAAILPIGLDWFILDLLASAALFIPLERWFALRREQPILRAEWRLDVQYFALIHLLVSAIVIVSTSTVSRVCTALVSTPLQDWIGGLPLWIQMPLILLVADLGQYTSHRLMHTVPFLWRLHAIHHSSPAMDWLASSRIHLGELLITRTSILAPIFVLGFSPLAIQLYVVFIGLHAIFVHANVRFTFGGLRHVLVTPAFHHWHHSDDSAARNTNYAVHLPLLDRLFGTHHLPRQWPVSYGLGGEQLPGDLIGQLAYPITGALRKP